MFILLSEILQHHWSTNICRSANICSWMQESGQLFWVERGLIQESGCSQNGRKCWQNGLFAEHQGVPPPKLPNRALSESEGNTSTTFTTQDTQGNCEAWYLSVELKFRYFGALLPPQEPRLHTHRVRGWVLQCGCRKTHLHNLPSRNKWSSNWKAPVSLLPSKCHVMPLIGRI